MEASGYHWKLIKSVFIVLVVSIISTSTKTIASHDQDVYSPHNGDTINFEVTMFIRCEMFQDLSGFYGAYFWAMYTEGYVTATDSVAKVQTKDGFVNLRFTGAQFCGSEEHLCGDARQIALRLVNNEMLDAALVGPWCSEEIAEVLEAAEILHFVVFIDKPLPSGRYRFQSYYDRSSDFAYLIHHAALSGVTKFGLAYAKHENAINRAKQVAKQIHNFSNDIMVAFNESYSQHSEYKGVLEGYRPLYSSDRGQYKELYNATLWDDMLFSMKEAGVQYAMFFSYGERVSIMNRIAELGINFHSISFDESGPEMTHFLGEKAEFVTSTLEYIWTMNTSDAIFGSNENVITAWRKVLRTVPAMWSAKSIQSLMVLSTAIERANSIAPDKLLSEMQSMDLETFYSPVKFSSSNVMTNVSHVSVQTQNGVVHAVLPTRVASASLVMPMPPWECRVLLNKVNQSICSDKELLVWENCTQTCAYVNRTYNSTACITRQREGEPISDKSTSANEETDSEKEISRLVIFLGLGLMTTALICLAATFYFVFLFRNRKLTKNGVWLPINEIAFDLETNGNKTSVGLATHGQVYKATFQNHKVVSKIVVRAQRDPSMALLDIDFESLTNSSPTYAGMVEKYGDETFHKVQQHTISRLGMDMESTSFRDSPRDSPRLSTLIFNARETNSRISETKSSQAAPQQSTAQRISQGALTPFQSFKWNPARKEFELRMQELIKWKHANLLIVHGALADENDDWCIVTEYMAGGSLREFLDGSTAEQELVGLVKILIHVADGILYLHNRVPATVHGDLSTSHVYIDHHFVAKVGNFCLYDPKFRSKYSAFWWAPELITLDADGNLASLDRSLLVDPSVDVYSFGIVMWELFSRQWPYESHLSRKTFEDILQEIAHEGLRPEVPTSIPEDIQQLMRDCWREDPGMRPDMEDVLERLRVIHEVQRDEAVERAQGIARMNQENAQLLHQMLPLRVAEKLRKGHKVPPEEYDQVTIFFSDIVGFTNISAILEPQEVMNMLDRLYTKFDQACASFNLFKVETIGDAYMCVGGIPDKQPDQTARVCLFAAAAISAAKSVMVHEEKPELGCVNIRAGMHTGRVIASVVGELNPRYCLFGDTVNTASRMESNSEKGEINLSPESNECLHQQVPGVVTRSRGILEIKGKGPLECFFLEQSEENMEMCQRYLIDENFRRMALTTVNAAESLFERWFNFRQSMERGFQ